MSNLTQDMGEYFINYRDSNINGVVFNGKSFFAVTSEFTFRSTDGLNWERLSSNSFDTPQRKVHVFRLNDKGNALIWDGKRVFISTDGVVAQTDNGEKWTYASNAPCWGKQLYYENNLYFSDIFTSADAVSWEPTVSNLNPGEINSLTSFKGKLYAFGIKGMILRGEILSRPEPADISYIWADTAFNTPTPLKGIKEAAKNGRLCLPADIISGLIEGQLKVAGNGSFKLSKDDMSMDFNVESSTAHINGKAEKLPAACYLEGKRLMVPAAFVFDKFGIKLEYNNVSKIITLSHKK